MWNRFYNLSLTIILGLLFLPLLYSEGYPAEITVTPGSGSQAMEVGNDNVCTLYEAFQNAKSNDQAYPDCAKGDGTDTIILQAETYNISESQYYHVDLGNSAFGPFEDNLTIKGAGPGKTILKRDSNNNEKFRFFIVQSDGYLRLVDLTLQGGHSGDFDGGAIYSTGMSVSLEGVVVKDNKSNGNGGAVYSTGSVKSNRSLISGNSANNGGAFYLDGTSPGTPLRISNTTVTGNKASAKGGGVYIKKGILQFNFDTIAKNEAGDGGGGIFLFNDPDVNSTVKGTIIANNLENNCNRDLETVHSSLSSDQSCGMNENDGDVIADPKLTELADYGGPTMTLALMDGSPALNQGVVDPVMSPCGELVAGTDGRIDQRGATRPHGDNCDWGAYEKGTCGDGFRDPGEECDGGENCDRSCKSTSTKVARQEDGSTVPGGPAQQGGTDDSMSGGGCPFSQLQTNSSHGPSTQWIWVAAFIGTALVASKREKRKTK